MQWYNLDEKEVLEKLESNLDQGLSQAESQDRLEKYGRNEL